MTEAGLKKLSAGKTLSESEVIKLAKDVSAFYTIHMTIWMKIKQSNLILTVI